jgi:hypothetical protein
MSRNLLVIDPLTLIGRELLACLADREAGLEPSFAHTAVDDEHQIAELAGEAGLVPPLDDLAALDRADVIVVASDQESDRLTALGHWIDEHPGARVVDLGRTATLRSVTRPWASGPPPADTSRLRTAHPAVTAATRLARALESVGVAAGHVVAVDPVSHGGRESVEVLARQSTSRLQGHAVTETIDGHVLAFGYIAIDADGLQREVEEVLGAGWFVDRALTGCFHGHVAHLLVDLADTVDERTLVDLIDADDDLEVRSRPLALDTVPDADRVFVATPRLAPDGRRLSTVLMMDGLRVGGALTASELIVRLI